MFASLYARVTGSENKKPNVHVVRRKVRRPDVRVHTGDSDLFSRADIEKSTTTTRHYRGNKPTHTHTHACIHRGSRRYTPATRLWYYNGYRHVAVTNSFFPWARLNRARRLLLKNPTYSK